MPVVVATLVIVGVTALAVATMLFLRRTAPEGGYFNDGDRAAGVFGVLATGFSVLLGFLIFLAFESYDGSRSGADVEAVAVAQQVETAQLMPAEARGELTAGLVCYARFVVHQEWDQMESGSDQTLNPWGVAMFETLQGVAPDGPAEEAAYAKWLDQTADRQEARQHRAHSADGVIPVPLWVALFLITAMIIVFLLCFADSAEPARIQALLMGSVVMAIMVMLVVLAYLNDPYTKSVGSVEPEAMERTLVIMDAAFDATGIEVTLPCDEEGLPA